MGLSVYVYKNLKKVSDETPKTIKYDDYVALNKQYGDVVALENVIPHEDLISPFEEGFYTYESGTHDLAISYTTNAEIRDTLERIGYDYPQAFNITLRSSGTNNCVSYKVVEDMLKEFEEHYDHAKAEFNKSGDDYGEFMWYCYETYMKIFRECIEVKGVVRYC